MPPRPSPELFRVPPVSRVTLVTVPALTLGDLLLWHWSLAGSHDVFALISGLSLPPLLIASAWLLIVAFVGAIARRARRPFARLGRVRSARVRATPAQLGAIATASPNAQATAVATPPGGRDASSRKIAA